MKYMGSKRKISKHILPIILNNRKEEQYYVEPFCGGCNMLDKVEGNRIGNDINKYLIEMFKELCDGKCFSNVIGRDYYEKVRDSYNNNDDNFSDSEKGWVGFMGSFNGRFFDGGYSGHNVNGRDYIGEQIRNTLSQIPKLKNTCFISTSYDKLILPFESIIYCDPPYRDTKQYSLSKKFDYERFYQWCREMKKKGHTIFISEYQMPNDFQCLWQMEVTNSLNTTKTYRPIEKLFTL